MRWSGLLLALALALGCEAPEPLPVEQAAPDQGSAPATDATPLGVGPAPIARARAEIFGLAPIPETLRNEELQRRRDSPQPSYEVLRAQADDLAGRPTSLRGRLRLARPAGEGLWIVAMMLREDAERWVDPVYVLSVVEPPPVDTVAWVDGFVVGERTIGQHALPLLVAYSIAEAAE